MRPPHASRGFAATSDRYPLIFALMGIQAAEGGNLEQAKELLKRTARLLRGKGLAK
jgi:hypothetical protein